MAHIIRFLDDDDELSHIGTPRHSGRYPYGSGENPQRSRSFRQEVLDLKKKGLTQKEIADFFNLKSTGVLRAKISLEKAAETRENVAKAEKLKAKGYSNTKIGEMMGGVNESVVRGWLDPSMKERAAISESTANMLKAEVEKKKYLDVGKGIEGQIGVSRTRLDTALIGLEEEGYKIHFIQTEQMGTGKSTSIRVLTKGDVLYPEVFANKDQIRPINSWSEDGGRTFIQLQPIQSISSERVGVRFLEDGGKDRDGVIQLRRGVKDLSLGDARYAQVRIAVDDTHFLKGMAIYDDNLPPGVDMVFNTNKSKDFGKLGVMKPLKDIYADNPFKATVRQKFYKDENGETKTSPLNIVGFVGKPGSGEEGSWNLWSKNLSAQFLSKQSPVLAKEQLKMGIDIQKTQFKELLQITNPAVKQRLLDSFSDDCDSKAVDLKAAALPRQSNKVIIPLLSLRPNEAYTETYPNGTNLVLIRHPHAGTFELPVVTVNNKNKEGKRLLGDAPDAIGIHPKTAEILSGADFDGDTVIAIPHTGRIKTSEVLKGLKDFDPQTAYKAGPDVKHITPKNKQMEMGKVSNLITDMTLKGASHEELTRAVRHSIVGIDSVNHHLDYKRSYIDNGIAQLKVRYQGGTLSQPKGAATLISRSKSETRVPTRRPITKEDRLTNPSLPKDVVRKAEYSVDKLTGKKIFVEKEEYNVIKRPGKPDKLVRKTIKSTKMYEEEDAMKLSSGTTMEKVYGDYANTMKALANEARRESASITPPKQNKSAREAYNQEVSSLNAKLTRAIANKPAERQAQLLAGSMVKMEKAANPDLTASDIKKLKARSLENARKQVNAHKEKIVITDKEWEAIQAGAVSHNVLSQILSNADPDRVKDLALPKTKQGISDAKATRAKALLRAGYTAADVADHLGISLASVEGIRKET